MMTWQWLIKAGQALDMSSLQVNNTQINATQNAQAQNVLLSPDQRALAYGDGFFTTMGVQDGKVLWQNEHAHRLQSHAQALQLPLSDDATAHIWQTINAKAKHINAGILKLIISRQPQDLRGYAFAHFIDDNRVKNNAPQVWLGVSQVALHNTPDNKLKNNKPKNTQQAQKIPIQSPITALRLSSKLSCLPPALVGLKTLNRLDNVLAAGELERRKYELNTKNGSIDYVATYPIKEGVISDVSGQWVEGVMSNFFYQLASRDPIEDAHHASDNHISDKDNNQWYTPPIDKSGVNGVMRQVIMQKAIQADKDNPILERRVDEADLANIKALFFCNAVRGVMPVAQLVLNQDLMHRLSLTLPVCIKACIDNDDNDDNEVSA